MKTLFYFIIAILIINMIYDFFSKHHYFIGTLFLKNKYICEELNKTFNDKDGFCKLEGNISYCDKNFYCIKKGKKTIEINKNTVLNLIIIKNN
jgi:dihydroorotase